MSGIIGQFFISFGLTIVVAVLISLAVARLITPMIAAYFLKAKGQAKHGEGWLMDRYIGLLRWTLVHRWKTVGDRRRSASSRQIFAFAILPLRPSSPTPTTTPSRSRSRWRRASTLDQTRAVADRAAAVLRAQPDVAAVFAAVRAGNATIFVYAEGPRRGPRAHQHRVRARRSRRCCSAIRRCARLLPQPESGRRPRRLACCSPAPIRPSCSSAALDARRARCGSGPELRAPRIAGDLRRPEIAIRPRLDLMADLGVTTAAMSQAIRVATLGEIDQNSARFSLSDRQMPIRVALNESARRSLSTIENLPVPTATGGSVPLQAGRRHQLRRRPARSSSASIRSAGS